MIPNHVLILGSPDTAKLQIANLIRKEDNGEEEGMGEDGGLSGTIIRTSVATKYYTLDLNILIDEYAEVAEVVGSNVNTNVNGSEEAKLEALKQWSREFLSEECIELREVLDGFIYCISLTQDSVGHVTKSLEIIDEIRSKLVDMDTWTGFITIVGSNSNVNTEINEEIEDLIISNGYEYINFDASGKNEYKESIGKDRIIELIESNEWTHMNLIKHNDYEKNKNQKLNDMTKGLLSDDDDVDDDEQDGNNDVMSLEIDEIMHKLKLAKEEAKGLNKDEKEKYVKNFIERFIDYL